MNKKISFTMISTLLVLRNITQANDIAKGRALSGKYLSCHGATGVSVNPTIPNLVGKDIAYLSDKFKLIAMEASLTH